MNDQKSLVQLRIEADLKGQNDHPALDSRYQRILAAAIQECSQKGFKATTMAGVAKCAAVSTATLYQFCTDKTDLFFKCTAYMMPILAAAVTIKVEIDDPRERMTTMLINHGKAISDPFMAWLYRLYVSNIALEQSVDLSLMARAGRTLTETYWKSELINLEAQGFIRSNDHAVTINLLLGQIERRTILAQMLFGENDKAEPSLEAAARYAVTTLFANLGTKAAT